MAADAETIQMIDEGENFRLVIWRGVACCQVWRRPDVSAAEGTRYAAVLMNALRFLLTDRDNVVPGIVFDVREAPSIQGPNTMALLGEAVMTWSLADKHIALLVGPEEQRAQMTELALVSANGKGGVFSDVDRAVDFARAGT